MNFGAITNAVGQFVDDAVTALTGSDILGDAAGIAVNMATGNYIGAVQEGVQLVGDLQDAAAAERAYADAYEHPAESCPPRGGSTVEVEVTVNDTQDTLGEAARRANRTARQAAARRNGNEVEVEVDVRVGWADDPAGPGAVAGTRERLSGKLAEILNNPGLSLEDKIALLFGELLGGLDSEIEGTMDTLQAKQAAKERAESGAKGKPAKGGDAPSAADISRLSSELQILMQRRSQMQSLLSNIMGMSHQSAMQTISNIR